eukprot:7735941-Prorocentrum_lima.AAC.1
MPGNFRKNPDISRWAVKRNRSQVVSRFACNLLRGHSFEKCRRDSWLRHSRSWRSRCRLACL